MRDNFERSLAHVLEHEGGFADHPSDPGGATMKGVTLAVFRRFFGSDRTVNDLKNISTAQLGEIYRSGYWAKCNCDALPSGVDYAVFDSAVNSGPGRAALWLQAAIGAVRGGGIGPNTLAGVADHEPQAIIENMLDERMSFLRGLSTFSVFGRGWTKRVLGVRLTALAMSGEESRIESGEAAPSVAFEIVRRGSKGEWVLKLQEALGITADGDFDKKTEAALIAFQTAQDLAADGIAGRNTYRALGLIA